MNAVGAVTRSAAEWQRPKWQTRVRLIVGLIVADLTALLVAMLVGAASWSHEPGRDQNLTFMVAMMPLYFLSAFTGAAFTSGALARRAISVSRALRALAMATGIVLFVAFYLKASTSFSRGLVAISILAAGMTLATGRLVVDALARQLLGREPWQVITICDGMVPSVASNFTIFVDSSIDSTVNDRDPLYREHFAQLAEGADRVIVLCEPARRALWTAVLRGASVQGEILHEEVAPLSPVGVGNYQGMPTMVITRGPLDLRARLTKRAVDILVSGMTLLMMLPIFIVIALAIRLHDGGPVFFLQPRLGLDNRKFTIYKFRTMRIADSDAGGVRSTARNDDRVTPIGRLLRASSFDEMPQLLNVLRGQMSLVGPRPHALGSTAEDQLFWDVDERYWHRHAMKPGMTGLAQVRGFRGATQLRSDLTNRLQSDLEYTIDWTIWRDILIIARTCGVVFHRNAF